MCQHHDCVGADRLLARRQLELSLVGYLFWSAVDSGKGFAAEISGETSCLDTASLRPFPHRLGLGDLCRKFRFVFSYLSQGHVWLYGFCRSEIAVLSDDRRSQPLHYGPSFYRVTKADSRKRAAEAVRETDDLRGGEECFFAADSSAVHSFSRKRYL